MYIYSVLVLVFYSILRFLMALESNNHYGSFPFWLSGYPLGYPMDHPIDVENGHRHSGFTHEFCWWFSIVFCRFT